eukprot:1702952-Amphidinium_carterae.1
MQGPITLASEKTAACGYDWRPRRGGPTVKRKALCSGDVSHELLWSCNAKDLSCVAACNHGRCSAACL